MIDYVETLSGEVPVPSLLGRYDPLWPCVLSDRRVTALLR